VPTQADIDRVALALDPVQVARAINIEPDLWQKDLLRSRAPRILLNASRQSGKSTMVSIIGVHRAVFTPNSLILLVSRTLDQSVELFRKCQVAYRAISHLAPAISDTAATLELKNGSRIVSLPGRDDARVRGYSNVDLLLIDEAARVSVSIFEAVLPMLAVSGGRLIALSTPFGARGWWYEEWMNLRGEWERHLVRATEVPRISDEFLAEMKRKGEAFYKEEFMCSFEDAHSQWFTREEVEKNIKEITTWDLLKVS